MANIRGFVVALGCCLTLTAWTASVAAASPAQGRAAFDDGRAPFAYPDLETPPGLKVNKETAAPPEPPDNAESTAGKLRLAGMVCGAAGLVSLGAGVYYWTRATSLSDSANKATVYNQADYDQGKRAETMQWIFYGVGAAAVVTGATLYVYGRWFLPAKKASVSLAPIAGPGTAGLQAQGAF